MRSSAVVLLSAIWLSACSSTLTSLFDASTSGDHPSDSAYQLGKRDLANGQYDLAMQSFADARSRHRDSIEIINGLAVASAKLGRNDEAVGYFREALAIDPKSQVTLNNLAYFYLSNHDAKDAAAYGEQALRGSPNGIAPDFSSTVKATIAANLKAAQAQAVAAVAAEPAAVPAGPVAKSSTPAEIEAAKIAAVRDAPSLGANLSLTPVEARQAEPKAVEVAEIAVARDAQSSVAPQSHIASTSLSAVNAAAPARIAKPSPATRPLYRISNGIGRRGAAAHMAHYLAGKGISVKYLTNEKPFGREHSAIFYNPGLRSYADELASLLTFRAVLIEASRGRGMVEVVLGSDALAPASSQHLAGRQPITTGAHGRLASRD